MRKIAVSAAVAAALSLAPLTVMPLMSVNASATSEGDTVCFVLREYNGRIALFIESSDEPLAVYKMPLTSLYPGDVELLREGIRLKNRAEVTRLIADLGIDG